MRAYVHLLKLRMNLSSTEIKDMLGVSTEANVDQTFSRALKDMRGAVYSTPQNDWEAGPKGTVLIEDVALEQSSPDLLEMEVGYYRRMYTVRIALKNLLG